MKKYTYSAIIKRLQTEKRIPYLFIGAGFTRRYIKNSYKWDELLNELSKIIGIPSFVINNLRIEYRKTMSEGMVNQMIATYLSSQLMNKIKNNNYEDIFTQEDIELLNDKGYDAFKYLVAKLTHINKIPSQKEFADEKYKITELTMFKKLKNNIPAIFTTNYDQLIELLFSNEYVKFTKQSDYFYNDNFNYAEIYKIHGCVNDPNSIIITKDDYDSFKEKNHLTTSKLLQVLSSNPIIFIGYSMQDEDINEIINNLIDCLDGEKLKQLEKNLVLISWTPHLKKFIETKKEFKLKNKTINLSVIETDNYTQLFSELAQFKPMASPIEIRKYKKMIAGLINSNDKKLKYYVVNVNSNLPSDNDKVVSIVAKSPKSVERYNSDDIIIDYLKDNPSISGIELLKWTQAYFNAKYWIPLYFYIDINKEKTLIGFKKEKEHQFDALKKSLQKFPSISSIEQIDFVGLKREKSLNSMMKLLIDDESQCGVVKNKLKELLKNNSDIVKLSEFRKCVTLVSYLERNKK